MARPREFDLDQVLDTAMDVFWRKGYHATSMADLVEATGLHRGSLYAAFGSKAELYDRAVDRYMSAVTLRRALAGGRDKPVGKLLREVFDDIIESAVTDDTRRGCLMTNTAVELAAHQPQIADRVRSTVAELEDLLASRFELAQATGEIDRDQSPRALARFVLSTIQGLRVMAKMRPDRTALQDVASVALARVQPVVAS